MLLQQYQDYATNSDGKFIDGEGNVIADQSDVSKRVKQGLVLTPELWLEGYFVSMKLSFEYYGGAQDKTAGDSYYAEIQGTPQELDRMSMTGTFSTDYGRFGTEFSNSNILATRSASFEVRKAPYSLDVSVTGMRESKMPGDPDALVGNLEYARDNNGNIYYNRVINGKVERGIIVDGQFVYGSTVSQIVRKDKSGSEKPYYVDKNNNEGTLDGDNFTYVNANGEEQLKQVIVYEATSITNGGRYVYQGGSEPIYGNIKDGKFVYTTEEDGYASEDAQFDAVMVHSIGGVALTQTTDRDGNGNVIYTDASGRRGIIDDGNFVIDENTSVPVTSAPKTKDGKDVYVDRYGNEGVMEGDAFVYEDEQGVRQEKSTVFTPTGNKMTVEGVEYDEYENSQGVKGYISYGWFMYPAATEEEHEIAIDDYLSFSRDDDRNIYYTDGAHRGILTTYDGKEVFAYNEVTSTPKKESVNGTETIIVEENDDHTKKEFEGYIGDPGSGWRITVSNDSTFDIGQAVLKAGWLLKDTDGAGNPISDPSQLVERKIPYKDGDYTNFDASHIVIRRARRAFGPRMRARSCTTTRRTAKARIWSLKRCVRAACRII